MAENLCRDRLIELNDNIDDLLEDLYEDRESWSQDDLIEFLEAVRSNNQRALS